MFLKKLPEHVTCGEVLTPAMRVKTKWQAQRYFESCVRHHMKYYDSSREKAETVTAANIGYCFGYQSREDAARLKKLYGFGHPIFG